MENTELEKVFEAALFAAGEALTPGQLAQIAETDAARAKAVLSKMEADYKAQNRGIILFELDGAYQMCSNPLYYPFVGRLRAAAARTLTPALLETLAIIAYKQPVTKPQIEEIRGVNADHAVNRLMEYGLITEKGRLDAPGKPILFVTTREFLRHYGLNSAEQLRGAEHTETVLSGEETSVGEFEPPLPLDQQSF